MLVGWRTLLASVIIATLGALQALDWFTILSTPRDFGWAMSGLGIIMAIFRALTGTPITKPNAIASVDATPGVAGVITTDDPVGIQLARSIPSRTVVIAGTRDAAQVAKAI